MKKIKVIITTSFPAIHCWPDCNIKEVEYLRHPHRHVFHVVMKWDVTELNREIEFISKKILVDDWVDNFWREKDLGNNSCEDLAITLMDKFNVQFVSVYEDNENGAEVEDEN